MINLYDHEIVLAHQITRALVSKYGRKPNTPEILTQLRQEAINRFAAIGFVVEVDTLPCLLLNRPPEIKIMSRIEPLKFDHEKKAWEVNEAKNRGQTILGEHRVEDVPDQ